MHHGNTTLQRNLTQPARDAPRVECDDESGAASEMADDDSHIASEIDDDDSDTASGMTDDDSDTSSGMTDDDSHTASETDDDDSDTASEMADDEMADVGEDASLKQVVQKDIKEYLRCLKNSSNDKDRLEQMTKASVALFLHIASEESAYEGTAMWRTICEDDHLHSMFRGITAYRHLLHLNTAQFQTSNKDETEMENVRQAEMENARQDSLIQARCHWWTGLSAFSEKYWDAIQQKVFRELNLKNWRNIETNLGMLKPQEQAMIEAALTAYNHARVITYIRQEAQKGEYCPSYMKQRAQREHDAQELLQTSPTYLMYITKQDFQQRIDNFLKKGNCLCCRNRHT